MNYIAEINAFYGWLMFNPIPADAQALWHLLLQMNNKCAIKSGNDFYWKVEFSVSNGTITSLLSFSRQQLDRMRNVLIQKGRIEYKKGKGSRPGYYKIIPFDENLVENYVDNLETKVWITIVSHNVTQSVTQLDTQSGHNLIHKADTNTDLCNIIGTLYKQYKNNNKYNNNIYSGDGGGETRAHAHENPNVDKSLSDFLSELNSYFGMTEEIKLQVGQITIELFDKYFTRQPSKQDMIKVFERVYHSEMIGCREAIMSIDTNKKEVLEYAFQKASQSGNDNWAYLDGILNNLRHRGLKTLDDCEGYDVDRAFAKSGFLGGNR